MSPAEQRIAIAKACGWKFTAPPIGGIQSCDWQAPSGAYCQKCPDYLNSLDAMYEAEKILTADQKLNYMPAVCWVAETNINGFYYIHSTAAQRAEAFLKTLELWK